MLDNQVHGKNKVTPAITRFSLGGDDLLCSQKCSHLGVIMDMQNSHVLVLRVETEFFWAVNSLVAHIDRTCLNDNAWKKLVNIQLSQFYHMEATYGI